MKLPVFKPPMPAVLQDGFRSRIHSGVMELPVHYMRGGTSTGVVIWEPLLPRDKWLRAELLRHLMGVPLAGPHPGNRQITGLGRGPTTSNKVFLAQVENTPTGRRIVSTLAQLASDHSDIDWNVNCGNMSSALLPWALDTGLIETPAAGDVEVEIRNTNTGVLTTARMSRNAQGQFVTTEIPGVPGVFPRVDLFIQAPVGSKTGALLPTGQVIDSVAGHEVSCVDVAVPMVIADAASFGKTGHEAISDLEADTLFMARLRQVRIEAGLKMQLRGRDGKLMSAAEIERSKTIPKVCIVGTPRHGGHIAVRYFTPQTGHASMAVSGGCCLAAACLLAGTTAHGVAVGLSSPAGSYSDIEVSLENPAGTLDTTVSVRSDGDTIDIRAAAYRRNAQILMRGYVPIYRASAQLVDAMAVAAAAENQALSEK